MPLHSFPFPFLLFRQFPQWHSTRSHKLIYALSARNIMTSYPLTNIHQCHHLAIVFVHRLTPSFYQSPFQSQNTGMTYLICILTQNHRTFVKPYFPLLYLSSVGDRLQDEHRAHNKHTFPFRLKNVGIVSVAIEANK